jgi:peptidoglycan/LPS O-acetylase OafA/YrhL
MVFASFAIVFAILSYRLIERPLQGYLRHNPFAVRPLSTPSQATAVVAG